MHELLAPCGTGIGVEMTRIWATIKLAWLYAKSVVTGKPLMDDTPEDEDGRTEPDGL
jgi:hypothetical protein